MSVENVRIQVIKAGEELSCGGAMHDEFQLAREGVAQLKDIGGLAGRIGVLADNMKDIAGPLQETSLRADRASSLLHRAAEGTGNADLQTARTAAATYRRVMSTLVERQAFISDTYAEVARKLGEVASLVDFLDAMTNTSEKLAARGEEANNQAMDGINSYLPHII